MTTLRNIRIFVIVAVLGTTGGCLELTGNRIEQPKLLVCPSNETFSASSLIDPLLGGVVSVAGSSISVPPGALALPSVVALTVPAANTVEVDASVVGVEHAVFGEPVSVTIDYSRCGQSSIDNRRLSVWYLDPITGAPIENMHGTDDRPNRKITFTTDHFSGYAIAY